MALEERGWLVSESVPAGHRGLIDFLVTTPAVSFVIDVAEGQGTAAEVRLDGHLAWARERYGPGRHIEPVLCGDAAAGSGRSAIGARPISPSRLVPFLVDRG